MPALSPSPASPRSFIVTTPDQLRIHAQEWSPRTPDDDAPMSASDGPELLFIHGFSQAGLCWQRQTMAPELADFRKVTYDFRGHGGSDKPLEPEFYKAPERWADEVAAVIAQADLKRPILVGWSYAGRIICDYLAAHGSAHLGGIVFVDAVTSNERPFYGSCNRVMRQMCSTAVEENVAATRAFLRRCFAADLPQELHETLLAVNMMVPPQVRGALFGRPADYEALLAALDLPVMVVQGGRDDVVAPAMAHHIAALVPGARLKLFDEAGHAPFLEAAGAFNAALRAFASGEPV